MFSFLKFAKGFSWCAMTLALVAACVSARHNYFIPSGDFYGQKFGRDRWDVIFEHPDALVRMRIEDDGDGNVQAVVAFSVLHGEVKVDFSKAELRSESTSETLNPTKIERRSSRVSPSNDKRVASEVIEPWQSIQPGDPWIAMEGYFLLTFAAKTQDMISVTLRLNGIVINDRPVVIPPAEFFRPKAPGFR